MESHYGMMEKPAHLTAANKPRGCAHVPSSCFLGGGGARSRPFKTQ